MREGEEDSYGPRVIECKGGPLDGWIHEVEMGMPCPPYIGQQRKDGTVVWYRVDERGVATLVERLAT